MAVGDDLAGGRGMTGTQLHGMGGNNRADYGVVVTFENADGKRLVLHRKGSLPVAVSAACDDATTLDPTFLVICISTPQTIYSDIQGRMPRNDSGGESHIQRPEPYTLARAKRSHMLHPSIAGRARSTIEKART